MPAQASNLPPVLHRYNAARPMAWRGLLLRTVAGQMVAKQICAYGKPCCAIPFL